MKWANSASQAVIRVLPLIPALTILALCLAPGKAPADTTREAPQDIGREATGDELPAEPLRGAGGVVIDEQVWLALVDEIGGHLRKAHGHLVQHEPEDAVDEIDKAVSFIKIESTRAKRAEKDALLASSGELEALASEVKKDASPPIAAVDTVFARAQTAMAKHHYVKARLYWNDNDPSTAGRQLRAAALQLDEAWNWLGDKTDGETLAAINDAKMVATAMSEGHADRKQVEATLAQISQKIDVLASALHHRVG